MDLWAIGAKGINTVCNIISTIEFVHNMCIHTITVPL